MEVQIKSQLTMSEDEYEDEDELILYTRIPSRPWSRFIKDKSNECQYLLLTKFIDMDIEKYKIEKYNNNDNNSLAFFTTIISRTKLNNKNSDISYISYIYYYTTNENVSIEFMYCKSAYAAYINRLIDF